MAQLEERRFRGWDVLRVSTEARSPPRSSPGLGGTITSPTRRADAAVRCSWSSPGLRAPWGPLGAGHVPSPEMTDSFAGGWQTLFPNGGDSDLATRRGVGCTGGSAHLAGLGVHRVIGTAGVSLVRAPSLEITKIISTRDSEITVGETVRNAGRTADRNHVGQPADARGRTARSGKTVVDAAAAVVRP